MKYLFIFLLALFSIESIAQGKGNGKARGHLKNKHADKSVHISPGQAKKSISVPAGITRHFSTNYPAVTNTRWTRSGNNYMATYKKNSLRTTTTYTLDGKIVETRSFIPATSLPNVVTTYSKANPLVQVGNVVRLQLPDKEPVYRIEVQNGQYVYLNDNGLKVNF
jgi:hypothetical protein